MLVFGDDGETPAERYWGLGHRGRVFDEQIRVSLVSYVPGSDPRVVDEFVETVDLLPTLRAAVGVPPSDLHCRAG